MHRIETRTGASDDPMDIWDLDAPPPWILSPSDFAFLWDDCPRCFYRKIVEKERRPRSPFPSVFGKIDRAMKQHYLGERSELQADGMPGGVIGAGDRWVKSEALPVPGSETQVVIRGQVDVLVECDDGTLGIVDFKTTMPKADHIATYARQLHAYAWALERPSSGPPANGPPVTVSSLGLLCFLPDTYRAQGAHAGLFGAVEWVEIPRDDEQFSAFLTGVVAVLDRPEPPPATPGCQWCDLRDERHPNA
jgi:hypothetical protein